jgi:hypothetical protein
MRREILVTIPNMMFQEGRSDRRRKTGSRSSKVFFRRSQWISGNMCVCVWGGVVVVGVDVCDGLIWLRKEANVWCWRRNWPAAWNLRVVYQKISCFINLDYKVHSSAWRMKKTISSTSHEYSVLLQGLPEKNIVLLNAKSLLILLFYSTACTYLIFIRN